MMSRPPRNVPVGRTVPAEGLADARFAPLCAKDVVATPQSVDRPTRTSNLVRRKLFTMGLLGQTKNYDFSDSCRQPRKELPAPISKLWLVAGCVRHLGERRGIQAIGDVAIELSIEGRLAL